MTLISRVLGFVRDMVLAQVFGALFGLDAFLVAFKIPNFMRRLFAEGAFSQAFVPVLSEYKSQQDSGEIQQLINHVFRSLAFILFWVVLLGVIFAPYLIHIFAPGFKDGARFLLAAHLLKITAPYLLLIALTAFLAAVLNTYDCFGPPALTPVLLNVALIIAAVFFRHYFHYPVESLAWGVLVGGVLQFSCQWYFAKKRALLPRLHLKSNIGRKQLRWYQYFTGDWQNEGVRRILKLMVPALFGVSVAQISLLVDTIFASFLPQGSISWLYYSDRLTYFPLGIFGVALATVVLPHLSKKHAEKDQQAFAESLDWSVRMVLLLGVPSALGLGLLAQPLIATLFHYGRFNAYDVLMSSQSLIAYALGLPAFMLIKVLASGFYSQQNIKTPVKIAATALGVNLILNGLLIGPLQHVGLALATSISSWVNAVLLWVCLYRKGVIKVQRAWLLYLLWLGGACVLMVAWLWLLRRPVSDWLQLSWHWRALQLLLDLGVGGALYLGVLYLAVRCRVNLGLIR